jgi:hypothetical protein
MASLEELSRALVAADRAGDVQAAKVLAAEITKVRARPQPMKADPTEGMSGFDKFAAGMGKAMVDTARGVGQFIPGLVSREDVAESRKLDASLMNTGAGTAGNVAGNIAMLAPTALIPGAATIRGGAAIGALTGAIQPSVSTGETIGNTVLGGVAGAAVPAATTVLRTARSAAEPFYEAGRNRIVGRAINRAAGADAPAVAQRLREASRPFVGPSQGQTPRTIMGEYVPGSIPTAGQAAQNPGVAALERAAVAANPEMTNAVSAQMAAQNAARVGVLDEMAAGRSAADGKRLAAASPLYEQAKKATVATDKELSSVLERLPSKVMAKAEALAKMAGEPLQIGKDLPARTEFVAGGTKTVPGGHHGSKTVQTPGLLDEMGNPITREIPAQSSSYTGKALHYIKLALDDAIGKTGDDALGETEKRLAVSVKADLLNKLDASIPAYGQARGKFAELSKPVNQKDVAQELIDKSVNKLTGNLQPQAYARNLTDDTAQRATGMDSATLAKTMNPAQMNALQSILLDVQRANAAQTVGRGVGSDTVQKLAYSNILDQAGVPTFLRNFAPAQLLGNLGSRGADLAYGRANRELGNRLAEVMLDPEEAATLMLSAGPAGQNALLQLLARSASGVAMSTPALANAQKQ